MKPVFRSTNRETVALIERQGRVIGGLGGHNDSRDTDVSTPLPHVGEEGTRDTATLSCGIDADQADGGVSRILLASQR